MRRMTILIFCLVFANCARVETSSGDGVRVDLNKAPTPVPTVKKDVSLKPVVPQLQLNATQRKYLDEALPPKVREILEKAERFEVLAEVDNESDGMNFEPNRIAKITDESDKKAILEAFYFDASDGDIPSACYLPHHKIRAVYQGKTVEIEICFECSIFYVESPFGKFDGGIIRENRRSEEVLKRIVETESVELNK